LKSFAASSAFPLQRFTIHRGRSVRITANSIGTFLRFRAFSESLLANFIQPAGLVEPVSLFRSCQRALNLTFTFLLSKPSRLGCLYFPLQRAGLFSIPRTPFLFKSSRQLNWPIHNGVVFPVEPAGNPVPFQDCRTRPDKTTSHEVSFPSASINDAALSRTTTSVNDPASVFRPQMISPETMDHRKLHSCGFTLRVSHVPLATATIRLPLRRSQYTLVASGHAPRLLFHAAFRYLSPTLHHLARSRIPPRPATLMGFLVPCAVFLTRGSRRLRRWFSEPHAHPPLLPTCR
jgi:hypothetical protein